VAAAEPPLRTPTDGSRALAQDESLENLPRPRLRVDEMRRSPGFRGLDALDIDAECGACIEVSEGSVASKAMAPAALHEGKTQA
jgi:hypothetical protein